MADEKMLRYYFKIQNDKRQAYKIENRCTLRFPEVIFIGDSIVEFFRLEDYIKTQKVVANRGISAYTSDILLKYLDTHIFGDQLKTVFILIGTNDIGISISKEKTITNMTQIIEKIKENYPSVTIVLLEILPVNTRVFDLSRFGMRDNKTISDLNRAYEELTNKFDYVSLLETYDAFLDNKGDLKVDFTKDGLHLSDKGYQVLAELINQTEYL
ncbi:GDSL-type esterase/lipase family protein [Streptococcus sp. CSL10205-OR2]|uniref:GDSL-type esterase/lipase family protein n=1 Tax=Streptococcus sp. CSL10205-OR2 TaxID=2980558 RepID=UPI0021DAC2F5|nr:GDSL-type esterase/lipase family protein [Streptococcus sp. CSL10205-OR2]MCU9533188.1 GDSL-type esterase/lipase family protein [Streptococcus sp. CSL10205-OR2]